jgi:uncharacterized protein (DUF2236 family)
VYFDEQIRGDSVTVTPVARRIAAVIMRAPLPVPLRLIAPAHRLATPAQLPPRLRHEYGLRWTPLHRLCAPGRRLVAEAQQRARHFSPRPASDPSEP